MEELLQTKSIPALLVVIAIFMCAGFLKSVVEFLWRIKEKKDSASELAVKDLTQAVNKNTSATEHLDERLDALEHIFAELPKFKLDMRRLFLAVKHIAKEDWANIRKEIMEEDSTL